MKDSGTLLEVTMMVLTSLHFGNNIISVDSHVSLAQTKIGHSFNVHLVETSFRP